MKSGDHLQIAEAGHDVAGEARQIIVVGLEHHQDGVDANGMLLTCAILYAPSAVSRAATSGGRSSLTISHRMSKSTES